MQPEEERLANNNNTREQRFMLLALEEGRKALAEGEVPVGCVFVCNEKVIAAAANKTNALRNATLHAEIVAIDQIMELDAEATTNIFPQCELFVTCEPCVMCASALMQVDILLRPRFLPFASSFLFLLTPTHESKKFTLAAGTNGLAAAALFLTFICQMVKG
ncbi:Cytidine and deoxycytidylate deaminase zinc-binding domain protein [Balamuthia mandrillaris]